MAGTRARTARRLFYTPGIATQAIENSPTGKPTKKGEIQVSVLYFPGVSDDLRTDKPQVVQKIGLKPPFSKGLHIS